MARGISDDQHYKDISAAIRAKNETDTLYKPSEMAPAILAIQGGVELNFKVVGGETEPENPAENTIWVNTPNEITSWIFSAEEPESPEAGMVWFSLNLLSSVGFSALKESGVYVYPIDTLQYRQSEWSKVPAMVYQDEKWNELRVDLYNSGDERENITGGWSGDGYTNSSYVIASANKEATFIDLYSQSMGEKNNCGTVDAIDLTGFSTIVFTGTVLTNATWEGANLGLELAVCKTKNFASYIAKAYARDVGDFSIPIDVTDLNEKCYIHCSTSSIQGIRGYIYSVKLKV